jgi:glycosyltransferase involved in cell wall biosynthesis
LNSKVGVIIRTKNRAIFLDRAIRSVLEQSYTKWMIVIVNDGGNREVVDELVDKYKDTLRNRVNIVHNPQSLGREAASNIGVRNTSCEYVVIHDDDDSWEPTFLEKTVGFLESQDGKTCKGVATKANKIIEEIKDDLIIVNRRELWRPEIHTINLIEMANRNVIIPITFLYRRSVHQEIGYYDESLEVLGDWEFNIRFLLKYDVFLIPELLANYHHRLTIRDGDYSNSAFGSIDKFQIVRSMIKNKYLRKDIESGSFGLGWMLNSRQSESIDVDVSYSTQFIVKQLQYNNIDEITLYGTGGYAHKLYIKLLINGIRIKNIVDSNPNTWGKVVFDNLTVQSLDEVMKKELLPFVIASYSFTDEMIFNIRKHCEQYSVSPIIFAP